MKAKTLPTCYHDTFLFLVLKFAQSLNMTWRAEILSAMTPLLLYTYYRMNEYDVLSGSTILSKVGNAGKKIWLLLFCIWV